MTRVAAVDRARLEALLGILHRMGTIVPLMVERLDAHVRGQTTRELDVEDQIQAALDCLIDLCTDLDAIDPDWRPVTPGTLAPGRQRH